MISFDIKIHEHFSKYNTTGKYDIYTQFKPLKGNNIEIIVMIGINKKLVSFTILSA